GIRDIAVRRACAGLPAGVAGIRPRGRPASDSGRGREGDRVRTAPHRAGRHAVLAVGLGRAGHLAAGDPLRAARADLHDLRAGTRRRGLLRGPRGPRRPVVSRWRAPRGAQRMIDRTVANVTCLGCGCACDDITIVVTPDRIAEARNACALGIAWFGDGTVPAETRVNGRTASLERALTEAARLLTGATRPLVFLAGDVSCETLREGVAIADRLRAAIDSLAATAGTAVLAAQRRGRAGATLGEIRQRADLVVFWAVDPSARYPRSGARYVAIVTDGEPGTTSADPARAEALVTLSQALNGPTRCALSTLRGGGNRSGADAVLTWQTGFPFAVDFARGYPSYQPQAGAAVQ